MNSPGGLSACALLAALTAACSSVARPEAPNPAISHGASGKAIVVCGERVPIDAPVVLWTGPGGFDAYVPGPVFSTEGPRGLRYTPGREWASDPKTLSRDDIAKTIDLFVLHYDICGFSRRCFGLVHDERALSAHFLLDADGTLYQTLDLRDRAWHGRFPNSRSIGVEIANMGVVSPDDPTDDPHRKRRWYVRDGERLRLEVPAEFGDPGFRRPGPFYSARNHAIRGRVHGKEWEQVDFTPQPYDTLLSLTVALRGVFPRIALEAPRDADGGVRTDQLTRAEVDAFRGILGHGHITTERNEPGPAFDGERFLARARWIESLQPFGVPSESGL